METKRSEVRAAVLRTRGPGDRTSALQKRNPPDCRNCGWEGVRHCEGGLNSLAAARIELPIPTWMTPRFGTREVGAGTMMPWGRPSPPAVQRTPRKGVPPSESLPKP